jgi:hypothetical protein
VRSQSDAAAFWRSLKNEPKNQNLTGSAGMVFRLLGGRAGADLRVYLAMNDLIQSLLDDGVRIRSKKASRPASRGFYGETYRQAISDPIVRKLFVSRGGSAPDVVTDNLRRSCQIPESATVDDLWERLLKSANNRRVIRAERIALDFSQFDPF